VNCDNVRPGDLVFYEVRTGDNKKITIVERLGLVIGEEDTRPLLRIQPIEGGLPLVVYLGSIKRVVSSGTKKNEEKV